MNAVFKTMFLLLVINLYGCGAEDSNNAMQDGASDPVNTNQTEIIDWVSIQIRIIDLFSGEALAGAFVDFGDYGNAITGANGVLSATIPISKKVPFYTQKNGYMIRHSSVRVDDSGSPQLTVSLIDLNHPYFDLHAYKKIIFDCQAAFPYNSTRWISDPEIYVDISPDKITGQTFTYQQIENLRLRTKKFINRISNGYLSGERFSFGVNPPDNNVIVINLDSQLTSSGAVGGGFLDDGEIVLQVITFKNPLSSENDYVLMHELGHTIGLAHTNGVPSVMTSFSIYYDTDQFMLESQPTKYDEIFTEILYNRAPGTTTEYDIDTAIEYDSTVYPFVCDQDGCRT